MTPAAELRAAAEQLRRLAADATAGPWRQHDTHLDLGGHTATVLTDRDDLNKTELIAWVPTWTHQPWDESRNAWNNAAYMAAMHPGVGAALADWLEREARQETYTLAEFGHRSACPEALAVARAINGSKL
ncbi:hypothetical protein ACFWG0_26490 [Streptomyces yangpuensis]|uniref:hypothetical protein n=1 Tax=Streptomyces yangpuensis TaxID=1648182 RepID=UPI00364C2CCA